MVKGAVTRHACPVTDEELSKSMIWYTTPMQQRSKSGLIRSWLSATVGIVSTDRASARFLSLLKDDVPHGSLCYVVMIFSATLMPSTAAETMPPA